MTFIAMWKDRSIKFDDVDVYLYISYVNIAKRCNISPVLRRDLHTQRRRYMLEILTQEQILISSAFFVKSIQPS